jgi:hypothetical protein
MMRSILIALTGLTLIQSIADAQSAQAACDGLHSFNKEASRVLNTKYVPDGPLQLPPTEVASRL